MSTLSPTIIHILAPFAIIFSCSKTWTKAVLLMTGAILCKGGRTVCGALKVMGLQGEHAFAKYHRVLNRDQWDALEGAKILLLQIITALGITELVVALDDHQSFILQGAALLLRSEGLRFRAIKKMKKKIIWIGLSFALLMCSYVLFIWLKRRSTLGLPMEESSLGSLGFSINPRDLIYSSM